MPPRPRPHDRQPPAPWRAHLPSYGLGAAVGLMVLAMAIPAIFSWNVRVNSFPPLHAEWDPRVGVGTLPALLLAGVLGWYAVRWAETLPWRRLLLATFVAGLLFSLALAFVDGPDGIGYILDTSYEYLDTARATTDFHAVLQEYVSRISYAAAPDNWPVHIAGHPPGALLFFVVLDRIGLGSGFGAGMVVAVIAATTPLAVMVAAKSLGSEQIVRRAAPFLALGPAVIWQAVSADALFGAVGAWGLAALALAATRGAARAQVGWAVVAGLLLGYTVMMSYGLPLLGILALTILWLARSWRPLPIAAAAALAVVLVFAALGFNYLDALGQLHDRYWEGVGGRRTPWYWMWGNLGAFFFAAGPLAGAGIAWLLTDRARPRLHDRRLRFDTPTGPRHAVWVLAVAGVVTVLMADASQMSKAEVERIWLPFVPWVLLACALLPERWRVRGLWLQLALAVVLQHLLFTGW